MPKKELIKDLSQISSLPLGKSKKFLKTLVSVLSQQLAEDKKVLIKNLGTFKLKKRVARTIKNPKTKQEYQIPERKVPVFIVSFNLKKSIGKNYISNEPKSIPTEPLPAHISEKLIPIRQLTNKTPTNQSALKPAANPELKPKFKPEPKPAPTQEQKKSFLFRNIFGGRKKLPPAPTHIQPQPQPQIKFSPQLTTKPIIVKPYQPSSKLISETEPESKELTLAHPSAKGKVPKNIKQAQNEIISSLKKVPSVKSQINYLDLKQKKIPKEILVKIPEYIAKLYQAVPVEEKDGKLIVAMVDPEDYQAIEFIKKKTGLEIKTYLATQEDIGHVLEQYPGLEGEIEKEIKKAEIPKELKMAEKKIEEEDFTKTEAPTSRAVNSILKRAVIAKASDVHIEPYENEVVVRFRIDGVLQKIISLPKSIHQAVISRIKILSNMRIDETRLPQDGRFEMKVGRKKIDFRVSVFPTSFGEKSVMRILDKSGGILTLKELGVRGRAFDLLEESIKKSHGLVLVTGPTGSGKSTTLYAVLMELNQVGVNIVTLEDPVEYQIPGINQGQVRADIGFTFAKGLRSILR